MSRLLPPPCSRSWATPERAAMEIFFFIVSVYEYTISISIHNKMSFVLCILMYGYSVVTERLRMWAFKSDVTRFYVYDLG